MMNIPSEDIMKNWNIHSILNAVNVNFLVFLNKFIQLIQYENFHTTFIFRQKTDKTMTLQTNWNKKRMRKYTIALEVSSRQKKISTWNDIKHRLSILTDITFCPFVPCYNKICWHFGLNNTTNNEIYSLSHVVWKRERDKDTLLHVQCHPSFAFHLRLKHSWVK